MNTIIKLGMHPFADTFVGPNQYSMSEPVYPLECVLNSDTGEIKLKHETKDDDRYNLYSYSYTSSNSKISRQHWIDYSFEIDTMLDKKSKILEIGSNDGFLTSQMIERGHIARGVDPSKSMAKIALNRGVKTYNMLFGADNIEYIKSDYGEVDVVLANNVFNHANSPSGFTDSVSKILKEDGIFVFELPYWLRTIQDKKFDQIYHEHVTYFTVKYAYNLLKKHGFEIVDIQVVNYHGGSLRVVSRKKENVGMSDNVKSMIEAEENCGLFDIEMYKEFTNTLQRDRNNFMSKIYEIKNKGIPIIGIGAAAKANTFLNFYKIDNTILDYVTDASEYKKGKFTPLSRIPIVGDEIFSEYEEVYALILSWNISDMLINKIKVLNNKVKFLSLEELL
jgi:SAM-dependent methyltransferase